MGRVFSGTIPVRLPPAMVERLDARAVVKGVTRSALIRALLEQALDSK